MNMNLLIHLFIWLCLMNTKQKSFYCIALHCFKHFISFKYSRNIHSFTYDHTSAPIGPGDRTSSAFYTSTTIFVKNNIKFHSVAVSAFKEEE